MKSWWFFLSLVVPALLLSACAPRLVTVTVTSPPEVVVVTATPAKTATPPPSPAPEEPKVLNVCLVGEPDTLYLYGASRLPATRHVMEALYDGPIDRRDYGDQPVILEKVPSLADGDAVTRTTYVRRGDRVLDADGRVVALDEGVRVRPTGCYTSGCEVVYEDGMLAMERMEVTFALRQDVTWSDGEPLTAEDSEFAFQVASDPATPGYRYLTERTSQYVAADRWHVTWKGVPGFIDPSYAETFFPPLPRHQLGARSPADFPDDDLTRRKPLGWGPFVLDEWVRGEHITLRRNPHYFRADEGLPHLDQVVFKVRADRWDVAAGLFSGVCDIGTHDAGFGSLMPLLTRTEEAGLLQVASAPAEGMMLLSFGVEPSDQHEGPHLFADRRVRQGIAKCVDRQDLIDAVTHGRSVAPDSYLPPGDPRYPEDELTRWSYDPAGGRALLDASGWRDLDGDGVREAQDVEDVSDGERFAEGEPFAVTLLASADDPASQETARILRAQLADCGVRVTIDERRRWEIFADGPEGPLFGRQFDAAAVTWWFDEEAPCQRYLSSEVPQEGGWGAPNITGYRNASYDDACLSAWRALPGTPAHESHHRAAQIVFSEDVPALPLFMPLRIALARPSVKNFRMDATAESELWDLESVDVSAQSTSP